MTLWCLIADIPRFTPPAFHHQIHNFMLLMFHQFTLRWSLTLCGFLFITTFRSLSVVVYIALHFQKTYCYISRESIPHLPNKKRGRSNPLWKTGVTVNVLYVMFSRYLEVTRTGDVTTYPCIYRIQHKRGPYHVSECCPPAWTNAPLTPLTLL